MAQCLHTSAMIRVPESPRNRSHFRRLIAFAADVVSISRVIGISPIMSGSLAVFVYTRHAALEVHDVDLSCSEEQWAALGAALADAGIEHDVKAWRVLQAFRDGLKVEFDSTEYWMRDLPGDVETVVVGGLQVEMVSLPGLMELYRRGLAETSGRHDEVSQTKHLALEEKYRLLQSVRS